MRESERRLPVIPGRKKIDPADRERKARRAFNRSPHGKIERDRRKALAKLAARRRKEIDALRQLLAISDDAAAPVSAVSSAQE